MVIGYVHGLAAAQKSLREALRSRKLRPIDQRRISLRQRGGPCPMAIDWAMVDAAHSAVAPVIRRR